MTESGPPRAFSGTPTPPLGEHDLRLADIPIGVFVDTSTLFQITYRLELAASAQAGDLAVYWSIRIQDEVARVAERTTKIAVARRARGLPPERRFAEVEAALDRMQADVRALVTAMEQFFRLASVETEDHRNEVGALSGPDDRVHILSAQAANVPYLLTLDQRHLPHGILVGRVQCWHPDTFLTLFYQQNRDAYDRAKQAIKKLPDTSPSSGGTWWGGPMAEFLRRRRPI